MKAGRWILAVSAAALLCSSTATPVYAHKNLKQLIQKIWPQKFGRSKIAKSLPVPKVPNKALEAVLFSKASNRGGMNSVAPLFSPNFLRIAPRPLRPAPTEIRHAVFTLQNNPSARGKGSAFAVEIDGEIWGVTARHVLDDIGRSPYLSVPGKDGKPVFFQVQSFREGNVHGADIAIFRLPQDARAYITPLQADYTLPKANSYLQSAGFSHGNFGWFPRVGVLFASDHRILIRYEDFPIRNGYCGSPLIKNGKVVAVFSGIITEDRARSAEWLSLLSDFKGPINAFNHAVPIQWVRQLVRQGKRQSEPSGVPLKLLGKTLGFLQPDENVQSIQQLRNGRLLKTIYSYPFMDYNHLERFLEIGPNDVIRLAIQQGDRSSVRRRTFWYQWDVQSGQLTRMERR